MTHRTFLSLLLTTAMLGLAPSAFAGASEKTDSAVETEDVPTSWRRLSKAQFSLNLQGNLHAPGEKQKIRIEFKRPELQELYGQEATNGAEDELLRYLIERSAARGDEGAIYALALCRVSGTLVEEDREIALELAEKLDPQLRNFIRATIQWRWLFADDPPLESVSLLDLTLQLLEDRNPEQFPEISIAATRELKGERPEEARAALLEVYGIAAGEAPEQLPEMLGWLDEVKDPKLVLEVLDVIPQSLIDGQREVAMKVARHRLLAAVQAGESERVGIDDLRLALAPVTESVAFLVVAAGAVLAVAGVAGVLILFDRRRVRPSWWSVLFWIGFPPLALGLAIFWFEIAWLVSGLILVGMLLSLTPRRRAAYLALPARPGRTSVVVVLATGGVFLFYYGYSVLLEALDMATGPQFIAKLLIADGPVSFILRFGLVAVLVPAVEELGFRGLLHDRLRAHLKFWPAALIGSAVFGIMHGIEAAIPTGAVGIVTCVLRERTGSLWPGFGLHALNNGAAVVLLNLYGLPEA